MKLEICANSYISAKNAQDAGAHRIELCEELSVGGITPNHDLIKKVLEEFNIPVFVLIRPRSGNFVYSDSEFNTMKQDIKLCKSLGCAGVVAGVLKEDKSIDIKRTKELIDLAKPLEFTFHRAFDEVSDPIQALNQLIEIKVERVLTSGQKDKAEEGLELLKELEHIAKDKVIIMPGAGINDSNVILFKQSGFKEIHASASSVIKDELSEIFSTANTYSDAVKIKRILKHISHEN